MTIMNRKTINLNKNEQKKFLKVYPNLLNFMNEKNLDDYHGVAISVFDHWLEEEEYINY